LYGHLLKGQSHKKVREIRPWDVLILTGYWFLNFSDRPFDSCDPFKIKFCLRKLLLSWKGLAPLRMPIWYRYPVRSAVYTGR
jgi:hypothetical protein